MAGRSGTPPARPASCCSGDSPPRTRVRERALARVWPAPCSCAPATRRARFRRRPGGRSSCTRGFSNPGNRRRAQAAPRRGFPGGPCPQGQTTPAPPPPFPHPPPPPQHPGEHRLVRLEGEPQPVPHAGDVHRRHSYLDVTETVARQANLDLILQGFESSLALELAIEALDPRSKAAEVLRPQGGGEATRKCAASHVDDAVQGVRVRIVIGFGDRETPDANRGVLARASDREVPIVARRCYFRFDAVLFFLHSPVFSRAILA